MDLWFPTVTGFPVACALQHPSHLNSLFPPFPPCRGEAGIGFAIRGDSWLGHQAPCPVTGA